MINNKKASTLVLFLAGIGSTSAIAGVLPEQPAPQSAWNYVIALSAGPVWTSSAGKTQTLTLSPGIEKTYNADNNSNTLGYGEIFFGAQTALYHELLGQLGLALAASSNATLKGEIWDDADSEFNNFTYKYKINHTHVAAKGKLLYDGGYWVIPWVSVSLGVGFNNAHGFSNTPTIFEALPNANFSSNTKTAFSYTLGAGIQKPITDNWQLGVGYEFADWGKSQLGRAFEQTEGTGLKLNHLYTNGLLFNVTYLA